MKKTIGIFFAFAMILSLAFVGDVISTNNPLSVKAQTGQVTVRRKRSGGVVGATGRGVRYVYRGGKRVAVYSGRKAYQGGKYAGKKTYQGGKYVGGKTVDGAKVVGGKTVDGTKYVGKKTVGGAKAVGSKTKKILTGN